ncbi:MAG: FKBP-type peptidyl-prolyl cis-trans isomerase [Prevotellaceae bacterium]|nr:FKBP-type peptidyl-prolyl cis-trans isomerase [Prevotellaceae bacterium]
MKKILFAAATAAAALLATGCEHKSDAGLKNDADSVSYAFGIMNAPEERGLAMYLERMGCDSTCLDDFIKGYAEGLKAADDKGKLAYYMGLQAGMQFGANTQQLEMQVFSGDSTKHINKRAFLRGFKDFYRGNVRMEANGKALDRESANEFVMEYVFGAAKRESAAFMAKVAKTQGIKALEQGIYYRELKAGDGVQPTATSEVEVIYEGRLGDNPDDLTGGSMFDSTMSHGKDFDTLPLNSMVKGWQVALPHMKTGSKWELYLPAEMAYGPHGRGGIPPYSALVFIIELVGVK